MQFSNYRYHEVAEKQRMQFTKMSAYYMKFKKANRAFHCVSCKTEQSPGMRYIGDNYVRICMKCAPTYMTNTIEAFKGWLKYINNNKKICEENKELWMKEALVGALQHSNKQQNK